MGMLPLYNQHAKGYHMFYDLPLPPPTTTPQQIEQGVQPVLCNSPRAPHDPPIVNRTYIWVGCCKTTNPWSSLKGKSKGGCSNNGPKLCKHDGSSGFLSYTHLIGAGRNPLARPRLTSPPRYCGWTKSCTTLKRWETIVCWYLQGNHHARVS